MKEKIKSIMSKKTFHICMIIVIIAIILFVLGIIILRYNVEGEIDMPFKLTKITLISSSEGIDKESGENKWAFDINQNNDIYLYIEKNKEYTKQEAIKSIVVDNIMVQKEKDKGMINFYQPNTLQERRDFSKYTTKLNAKNRISRRYGVRYKEFKNIQSRWNYCLSICQ